jgi:glycosyltransferase involved in cell wall biosynthesis
MLEAVFAVPGALDTPTGGYAYARALLRHAPAAGLALRHLPLPGGFPFPDAAAIREAAAALAAVDPATPLLVDGLALGALPAAALAPVAAPLVALVHHPLMLETGLSNAQVAALRASEAAALARARAVICPSAATAAQTAALFGLSPGRMVVAPPGLTPPPRAEGSRPPRILTLASLSPRKGHDTLLTALESLSASHEALWAGATDLAPDWAAALRARLAQSPAQVRLTGALEDAALEEAWRGADVFCLPSRHEGYGMVFAEAMAAGLPVVACAIPATQALVPPDAGVLTPPEDSDALAAALRALLEDPRRRRAMGAAAAQAARDLPRWPDTARIVAQALARAAQGAAA